MRDVEFLEMGKLMLLRCETFVDACARCECKASDRLPCGRCS